MEIQYILDGKIGFVPASDLELYRFNSLLEKEPETIEWVRRWSQVKPILLDIGANIGIYSLFAAITHPSSQVFSFEPVLNNFQSLVNNICANPGISVHPFNIAISDKCHISDLFISDLRPGNSGAQLEKPVNDKGESFSALKTEKVLAFSLDRLISDYGFPRPNYIKIDVDGLETLILRGMEKSLADKSLKSVLVELNNQLDLDLWTNTMKKHGLQLDHSLDSLPNHSDIRRKLKGNAARNYIFSRD